MAATGMNYENGIADADGDIAALVYSYRDRPDLVLRTFSERLAAAGRRLSGLVQLRDTRHVGQCGRVLRLDTWEIAEVGNNLDRTPNGCRLDQCWLDEMGRNAQASIQHGVDAVIVNRFGPLEAAGRGFCHAIFAASATETPLIVAVPEFEFERWTRFSNGMTVRLDCTPEDLSRWWGNVCGSGRTKLLPASRACESYK